MQVKARLFAYFREDRDKEVFLNLCSGANVKQILCKLDIKEDDIGIFLVNGKEMPL